MKSLKFALIFVAFFVFSGQALAAEYIIKSASLQSNEFPPQKAFFDFKEYVEKNSKGRIEVQRYMDGQLGNINECMEAVQMGIIQMTYPTISDLTAFDKRLGVTELPFMFPDFDTALKVLHGELGVKIEPMIKKLKMIPVGYFSNGNRSISNNIRPIYTPADLKGIKIRTMQSPVHIATFKALGANPTPISYSELYTSLQQGVVDAQENSALLMTDISLETVQKYYSLTNHVVSVVVPVVSEKWFEALPSDLQKVVLDGSKVFEKKWNEYFVAAEEKAREKMLKAGMKINDLTPAQRAEFQKVAQKVYKEFESTIGKDLINTSVESVKKHSKK